MEWIRTAKLKKYDVISAFSDINEIDWRKSGFNIKTGDIVYIYVGKPYSRIMYNVKSMSLLCLGVQTKGCTVRAS